MNFGTVIMGTPAKHGRFPVAKERTLFVIGRTLTIPTRASQSRRRTFEPDDSNGLWKPVDLMSEIRCLMRVHSHIEVLGELSPAAREVLYRKVKFCRPSLIVDLT